MINVQDKRIFGGLTDVNQLVPFKHKWAWESYLEGNRNHWLPGHIQFDLDTQHKPYIQLIGANAMQALELYLTWRYVTAWVCRELLPTVYRNTTSPECRQYMLRMLQEESVAIGAVDAVPLPALTHPEVLQWRDAVGNSLMDSLREFVTDDMEDYQFAAVTSFILQMKSYALVPLETYLSKECKLPEQIGTLVKRLEHDAVRQRNFFALLLANLLDERKHLIGFTTLCLNSTHIKSFRTHWTGREVPVGEKPIKFAEHCWAATRSALGVAVEMVPSPYSKAVVEVSTETNGLDWDD